MVKDSIRMREGGRYMEVTLPASKTDPFRKGIGLTISASEDDACPVKAMRQFLAVDTHRPGAAHSPLFCIGQLEQQAFTREYLVQRLQQLARTAGLGQGTWNGHSFRRGAATWAARVGISEAEIQTLARWRSYTYRAYIGYSDRERISLSRRFQTTQTPARQPQV